MKTNQIINTFAVLAAILWSQENVWSQEKPVEPKQTTEINIEAGGQARQVEGRKSFGFQQYRDIPKGAFLRQLDFRMFTEGKSKLFTFTSNDLIQRDQRFKATLEHIGKQTLSFQFDGFTRFYTNRSPFVLTETSRGVFGASAALKGALESAPTNAALEALAADAVANARQIEIRTFRERKTLLYTYQLSEALALRAEYLHDRRTGNRMFAMGTYNRIGTPVGDTFETPGQELYEPTSFGTNEFSIGADYTKKNWMVGVSYRASLFRNNTDRLIWQNPFRLTPLSANQPDGGLNRGRFSVTQAALPPDNEAHTITGNALVLLPRQSKLSGMLSWARWTQNQAFLPFTLNTAIIATNLPAGVLPTSAAALPRQSLQGLIHNLAQDYAFSSQPFRPIRLTMRYNDYDLKNETPEITFPGYATYGDSFWRTAITGQPGTTPVPIRSDPKSFHRKVAQFEGALRPTESLTWKGSYRWDRMNRTNREADQMTEHGLLTSVNYAPSKWMFAQGGFRYYSREADVYDPGTLEPPFLRMFDQADRQRKQGNALIAANLSPAILLSASWLYMADSYDKTFFGLHQQKTNAISADLTFNMHENFSMTTGWSFDRNGFDYAMVTKTSFPYSFANSWTRDTRDRVDSAHFGISGSCQGGKLSYQLNYAMALARMTIKTRNPNEIVANQVLNAQAYPFPAVKNQFHEFRLDGSYEVRKNVRIGLNWLLEPYRLNDFGRDVISPYNPGALAPENDARRYTFLDNGPTNYTGNLVAVYLRYSFR